MKEAKSQRNLHPVVSFMVKFRCTVSLVLHELGLTMHPCFVCLYKRYAISITDDGPNYGIPKFIIRLVSLFGNAYQFVFQIQGI